jgi:olefin beta-lactone synthetase
MTEHAAANIALHLEAAAAAHPDNLAVVVQRAGSGGLEYEEYTAQQLNAASDRMAQGLEAAGIRLGMRVVLMVKPSLEFFALTFALFKVGAVPVLIDPGIGLGNLKTCIGEAAPVAFVGIPKAHVARLVLGWGKPTLRIWVTVGRKWGWGGHTLSGLCPSEGKPYVVAEVDADDQAAILFTSGSTGIPKGAVYTHRMFNAQIDALRNDYGVVPGERDLATFPLFALFGPALGMAAVIPDMDATCPAKADPRRIIGAVKEYECTNMFASPALIEVVGRFGAKEDIQLPTLKRVVSSGAPADPESLERFAGMLEDDARILPSYGATESLPVAFISHTEQIEDTAEATTQGAGVCVGRCVAEAEVSIMKVTDDAVPTYSDDWKLPAGEPGEIVVAGPMVSPAYYNRDESTALAKMHDADGTLYHRIGDIGYFDEEGRLWMCGRKAHRVDTPEETLFSVACERIFNVHRAVRRTALVGVSLQGVTVPALCVEIEKGAKIEEDTLRRELLAIGQGNPRSASIQRVLFHPAFPVDIRHNAKIFREKLAVWAQERVQ